MKSDAGQNQSIWTSTADIEPRPPLAGTEQANVCIVGAGIAGLTTAYPLAREGKSVVVLDDGPIAGGETGRTTAHLPTRSTIGTWNSNACTATGVRAWRPRATRKPSTPSRASSPDEKIDCDFLRLDGYLFLPPGGDIDVLDLELDAAKRAGVPGVRMVERAPVPTFNTGRCLQFPRQGQFHIVKYMAGLAKAVERLGRTHLHAQPRRRHSGRRAARREDIRRSDGAMPSRRRGHEHARQQLGQHPHETGALPHVCHRRTDPESAGAAGAAVGHGRPVSLRPHAAISPTGTTS